VTPKERFACACVGSFMLGGAIASVATGRYVDHLRNENANLATRAGIVVDMEIEMRHIESSDAAILRIVHEIRDRCELHEEVER
jgi:ACT domain-containing protein